MRRTGPDSGSEYDLTGATELHTQRQVDRSLSTKCGPHPGAKKNQKVFGTLRCLPRPNEKRALEIR